MKRAQVGQTISKARNPNPSALPRPSRAEDVEDAEEDPKEDPRTHQDIHAK